MMRRQYTELLSRITAEEKNFTRPTPKKIEKGK
jgi:hypothetical protein